uniref:Fatty acid synthase n=1 Tax=Panstrongylus lignarius TaxID=156445 RepID=A0A224X4N0_9HEMI
MPARHQEIHHLQETEMMDASPGFSPTLREDIVISGISGRFPESANMEEFRKNLMEGIDMVTDDERRWPAGLNGLPRRTGKIKDLSKFDASFFGVHAKQAEVMDPQLRMLLEATYEALIDAGINPNEMRGTKTGVFIGASASESGEYWTLESDRVNGYGLTGCARAMFPNRISFTFDFKGPSFAIDTACSSSMLAFHQAVTAMRNGECDAAIVGGVNLLLKPNESLQFHRLSMLSPDGACKAFDASGNGYVRAEACAVTLLQKVSNAKRVYATVINTGTNTDGNKEQGITFPSGNVQKDLISSVFKNAGINPAEVVYLEAHGTGTKVGDPQEVNSIADVFCKGRNNGPLLVGSVKSNMGHSEPASGLCSLAKVVVAMESGTIPANLHFKHPNQEIPALTDGRLQVVNKNWKWDGGIAAINSFGFGGSNVHVILRSNPKPKSPPVKDNIPRLVAVSGRTYESVESFLTKIENMPRDDDFITLIHDIHKQNITGHSCRGYTVLGAEKPTKEILEGDTKSQVWYVFSGMGSQWAGMGRAFMCLEPFSKAIHHCAAVLKNEGVDLLDLIYHGDESVFDNILHCFVSIAAIQVALVDLLTALGISPDGIVGHSAGELGCAYADGAFTAEQTILAAYWRGKSILDSSLKPGAMAAVALSWEEAKARVPPNTFAACHNGADSVTVSGPISEIEKFVEELKQEEIFAKKVNSSNVAFHSKYIADAAPTLRANLERIIPVAKPRSRKWVSSSIPESGWSSQLAAYSSAAYHVNNLLSPVLFYEASLHIPEDAIVIEIAPHSLLQAIMKRTVPKSCVNIGLVKKGISDEMSYLLSNVGKLYTLGLNPNLSVFHRPSTYPVGRGTPMLSSLVEWDHSIEWSVADFSGRGGSRSGEAIIEVNTANETDSYVVGHRIDGRVLFPATGYLTLAWKAFAKINQKPQEELPVLLEDVHILRATILAKDGSARFLVNIFDGSGEFEICESGGVVVRGKISKAEGIQKDGLNLNKPVADTQHLPLSKQHIYRDLRLRGYEYSGIFNGIMGSDNCGAVGELEWSENWVSFMDTMLQFSLIQKNARGLYLPTRLQRVLIDPVHHLSLVSPGKGVEVHMHKNIGVVKAGGIEIRGMKVSLAPRRQQVQADPKWEQYSFIPYLSKKKMCAEEALNVAMQIVLENSNTRKVKVLELANNRQPEQLVAPIVVNILESQPQTSAEVTIIDSAVENYSSIAEQLGAKTLKKDLMVEEFTETAHIVVGVELASNDNFIKVLSSIKEKGFLLTEEVEDIKEKNIKKFGLKVISKLPIEKKTLFLLRKVEDWLAPKVLKISQKNFDWVESVKVALKDAEKNHQKYVILSENDRNCGILGMFNCLKQEPGGDYFSCVFIDSLAAKNFTVTKYEDHLKKGLVVNILRDNEWGSYRYLNICQGERLLNVEHAFINTLTRGDLSSLKWIEGPLSFYRPEHDVNKELCTVYYAPLNFRDIMLASGKLPPDALPGDLAGKECILGLEFAGRDSKGNRVMGILEACGLATSVLADPIFLWNIPAHWTMEQAATVPVVYATSYYALIVRGKLKRGESVLIHAGTGGVGQAAISIALHMGCTVFTTVGSQQKRDFLTENFPKLNASNIGNSRDTTFEQMVMEKTRGRGVDVILNSLAEDKLQASVRCLAKHGRFLEIGKFDLSNNTPLGMSVLLKNTSIHGILLDSLFEAGSESDEKMEVVKLIKDGISSGAVRPLPSTTFSHLQIEQSFRYMASGKHIGKVLLKIRDEEEDKVVKNPVTNLVPAVPRTYMNPDKSYVIVGGLGGLGLELTEWLLTRGAKNIVLVSRSGVSNGYQSMCLRRWKEKGLNVIVSKENPATSEGAKRLLTQSSALAPVGGIFNLAAVLRDAFFENQDAKNFEAVCNAKVDTTIALDKESRVLCPELDYFIVFSSVSCGRGNAGQTNYGMANSAMERICEARQLEGLPGMAIQWGAIGDVGLVMESLKGDNDMEVAGTLPQRITSVMTTMDIFLQQMNPVVSSMVLAEKRKAQEKNQISLLDTVKNILGIKEVKSVNAHTSLADLGMDSLMGAEIKQTLERNYDIVLNAAEIRTLTFDKLKELDTTNTTQPQGTDAETKSDDHKELVKTEKLTNGDVLVHFQDKTLMPNQTLIKMKDDFKNKNILFIVHPIEGVVSSLSELVSRLQCNVWGLQCTSTAPLSTIQELAEYYVKEVRKVQPNGPYNISGYSFGAAVAFEMAIQLESQKEKCTLLLLDGSPEYVLTQTEHYRERAKSKNETADEADAFAYFISLFTGAENYNKTKEELKALPDLKTRLKLCSERLNPLTGYDVEDISNAAFSFYKKLVAADKYQPLDTFKGQITLIKAEDNFTKGERDYGLSKFCKQSVLIHTLKGTHRGFLSGESGEFLAQIISSVLH